MKFVYQISFQYFLEYEIILMLHQVFPICDTHLAKHWTSPTLVLYYALQRVWISEKKAKKKKRHWQNLYIWKETITTLCTCSWWVKLTQLVFNLAKSFLCGQGVLKPSSTSKTVGFWSNSILSPPLLQVNSHFIIKQNHILHASFK